jgi:RNA polymerase sigma-70 factor (ECF subfamily)
MNDWAADYDVDDILKEYSDLVYHLALSRTGNPSYAEDVFQDVFLKLIKAKVAFNDQEHLKAWLIRVTINCTKDLRRSFWFRNTEALDENLAAESAPDDAHDVTDAVAALPVKYRTVIHLYYYEDLSIEEIAQFLQRKTATVASQLSRGRKLLKEKLKGEYDYGDVPGCLPKSDEAAGDTHGISCGNLESVER